MTPQDHNKVLGIMHVIWGGFNTLVALIVYPILFNLLPRMFGRNPNLPPEFATIFTAALAAAFVFALLFSLPPLLAGYAMLKRKRWAKVLGIAAACVEAISMPFGTALAVYSLWFHFGPGQNFHTGGEASGAPGWRGALQGEGAYDWEARRAAQAGRPREYTPPRQPPDWRG